MTNHQREVVPYAFIRIYNEQLTLKLCLESIVAGGITKGVICTHRPLPIPNDNSVRGGGKLI